LKSSRSALLSARATEFVESVLALHPPIAVFDCDGTLWPNDSGQDFFYWEIKRGLVPKAIADRMLGRYDEYLAGRVDEVTMCGEMVTMHAGMPEKVLDEAAGEFFASIIEPRIFPEMRELVLRLKAQGSDVWAVSSTNEWVVRAGVRDFGIARDHVLAARAAIDNGRATDKLLEIPTDDGKAIAIRRHINAPVACVFGNSMHDFAMLELAQHPFAINPNPDLDAIARERGWRVYRPI
jgi:phosphoserine phosphatase